jgi:hypothetical protein
MPMNRLKLTLIRWRVRRKFRQRLGYPLNLSDPKTYCEKIQWLKFNHNADDPAVVTRSDKYAVREFVQSRGFGRHLVPLYGSWYKPEDIAWQKLPARFVLKLNNGSGKRYGWFVSDKSEFSITDFAREANKLMAKSMAREWGSFITPEFAQR